MDSTTDIGRRILALYDGLVARGFIVDGWDGVPDHDEDPRGSIVIYLNADEEWLAFECVLYAVTPTATLTLDDVREAVAIAELLTDGVWDDYLDGTASAQEWVERALAATPYGD